MSILCRCRDLSRDVVIRFGPWILVVVKNNIVVLGPGLGTLKFKSLLTSLDVSTVSLMNNSASCLKQQTANIGFV